MYPPSAPQSDRYYGTDRDRDPQPMYQFGGNANSYGRRSPPRYDYAPGNGPQHSSYQRDRDYVDSYRPPQGEFTFRQAAPPSIESRRDDMYRPRSPPRQRDFDQYNRNGYRDNSNNNHRGARHSGQYGAQRGGQRGGYRGRGAPRLASDREFLKVNRSPTPELMHGMEEVDDRVIKYRPVEDLSDSDEAEMDISGDDNEDDDQPKKKQARTERKAADGDSIPKWSNPDPYTALPPPDESHRKKKDVVKLIRKARVEKSSGEIVKSDAAPDDFISFDFGDEEDDQDDDDFIPGKPPGNGVVGAPTGPKSLRFTKQQQNSVPAPESAQIVSDGPSNFANVIDLTSDPTLGSRKRTIRDEIKDTPTLQRALAKGNDLQDAPRLHKTVKGKPPPVNGTIQQQWQPRQGTTSTPWIDIDHLDTANMGVRYVLIFTLLVNANHSFRLHKEIKDFYEYVRPRPFEDFIRAKLVEDLQIRVGKQYRGGDIRTFGSFPAGLYLPTADMDLVCVSESYLSGGPKMFGLDKRDIRIFGQWLKRQQLVMSDSLDFVLGARVPLVKYVDNVTGLKIDISFENSTGLIANKTFQDWKAEYPAMPILVTLIKHFLAMRGLNEPVNGGIGGFSVTCLVVHLLKSMPQVESRSMIPEHHLGELLMEFFDLYGNNLNTALTAIQFDPPRYVPKVSQSLCPKTFC